VARNNWEVGGAIVSQRKASIGRVEGAELKAAASVSPIQRMWRQVAVHGVDGGQAGVAGADAVVPVGFEMVEEGGDHVGVEVIEVQL
jgi:hypothetical protein